MGESRVKFFFIAIWVGIMALPGVAQAQNLSELKVTQQKQGAFSIVQIIDPDSFLKGQIYTFQNIWYWGAIRLSQRNVVIGSVTYERGINLTSIDLGVNTALHTWRIGKRWTAEPTLQQNFQYFSLYTRKIIDPTSLLAQPGAAGVFVHRKGRKLARLDAGITAGPALSYIPAAVPRTKIIGHVQLHLSITF